MDIQSDLHELVEQQEAEGKEEELILHTNLLQNVMMDNGIPEPVVQSIEKAYEEEFSNEPPAVESLVDKKTMEANAKLRQQQALAKEVEALKTTIQEKNAVIEEKEAIIEQKDLDLLSAQTISNVENGDVVLQVAPEKLDQITSQVIEGRTCLVIPVEGNEHIVVNGEDFEE